MLDTLLNRMDITNIIVYTIVHMQNRRVKQHIYMYVYLQLQAHSLRLYRVDRDAGIVRTLRKYTGGLYMLSHSGDSSVKMQ
jgi:hypothetical protein